MNYIDLHTHTTASDGTYTPEQLVDYALKKKLTALAITDHDTIKGIQKARKYVRQKKLDNFELVSGIEFSTNLEDYSQDIHILGLYIDENDFTFVNKLQAIIDSRNERNEKMIHKLNTIGMNLSMNDVLANATNGVITRAHFGKAMLEKGYVKSLTDAFQNYIGNHCIAYVPREKLTPKKAIRMVLDCGGVPILAHPTLYDLNLRELEQLIKELVSYGLKGIEGLYPLYTKQEEKYLHDLAKQYNLLISGGSDFHGNNKANIDLGIGRGHLKVPSELLLPIKNLHESLVKN